MSNLRGVEDFGFQWSTDEQVYPFEKASDGSTLYCKEVDGGAMPNTGSKFVAHGLGDVTAINFYLITARVKNGEYNYQFPNNDANVAVEGNYVQFFTGGWNASAYTGVARLIYSKP